MKVLKRHTEREHGDHRERDAIKHQQINNDTEVVLVTIMIKE